MKRFLFLINVLEINAIYLGRSAEEWPYPDPGIMPGIVFIGVDDDPLCSGALITSKAVLSSGICLANAVIATPIPDLQVVAGKEDAHIFTKLELKLLHPATESCSTH